MSKRKRATPVTDFRLVPVDRAADRRRRWWLVGISLLLLLIGVASGAAGYRLLVLNIDASQQQSLLDAKQQEVDALRKQLVVYQTDQAIDGKARTKVRQQYRELQDQLAELRQAVGFYKNLMAPGSRKQGLYVEQLSLHPQGKAKANRYRFLLVLTQVGNNKWRPYLKGEVSWQLQGVKSGKPVTVDQGKFLAKDSDSRFSFRYFQELRGELTLPAGVTPQQLIITAESKGQRHYRVEHTYKWTSVEQHKNGTS